MKFITNFLFITVSSLVFSSSLLAQSSEFKVLPIFLDDNWKAQVEVAAVVGSTNFDDNFKTGTNYGVDLSFDCPVFTLPGDHILRQQLTLSKYDKNNVGITTIEMNPYYFFKLSKDLQLGFGPGISGHYTDIQGLKNKWIFGWQASVGLKYYVNENVLVGLDIRRQWTKSADLGATQEQKLDQYRHLIKVGYRF